jgi:YfiH family protein
MARITDSIKISFGDMSTCHVKNSLIGRSQQELSALPQFEEFRGVNQVHSPRGYRIDTPSQADVLPFTYDGDYIFTTQKRVALVIETADCAPVIFIDRVKACIAIAHAGWRGTLGNILGEVLSEFKQQKSDLQNIEVIIGPTARGCCYEVGSDFKKMVRDKGAFQERSGKIYFDIADYIQHSLVNAGIAPKNFFLENAVCTICSEWYCSYRRQRQQNLRQFTIVALK